MINSHVINDSIYGVVLSYPSPNTLELVTCILETCACSLESKKLLTLASNVESGLVVLNVLILLIVLLSNITIRSIAC